MTCKLLHSGADIIKIGIGPGSVCTTRLQTGVGYPQFSAVVECAQAAHEIGGMIIADGGCNSPGDVAKAIGGGADLVMIGGMFAGHNESGGENVIINGEMFKEFYGMSSATAMKKYSGGVSEYRSSEGKAVLVPSKGPIEAYLLNILGGIRSTCTYLGVDKIEDLHYNSEFVKVNRQLNQTFGAQKNDNDHGYARFQKEKASKVAQEEEQKNGSTNNTTPTTAREESS